MTRNIRTRMQNSLKFHHTRFNGLGTHKAKTNKGIFRLATHHIHILIMYSVHENTNKFI